MLLAVHDEAPHRLAIWIVGSSLTYCGWRRRQGGRGGGIGGRVQSGQLVLLIKAQWLKQDHLLADARTGSSRCLPTSLCSMSLQQALHCKPLVDFNASKFSNRDWTESSTHTMVHLRYTGAFVLKRDLNHLEEVTTAFTAWLITN